VVGRLIAWRIGRGKSKTWLYLFTTLSLSAQQVAELYAGRWNVETDLRSLKRTVPLHHLTAKTVDMMEKELRMAVPAYNLLRAVMCLAARQARLHPRRLSFTQVLDAVDYAWPRLVAARTANEHHREFQRVLDFAAMCILPNPANTAATQGPCVGVASTSLPERAGELSDIGLQPAVSTIMSR